MKPEWVEKLTKLQNEFAKASGKTFHSSWEDFLFVKLCESEKKLEYWESEEKERIRTQNHPSWALSKG